MEPIQQQPVQLNAWENRLLPSLQSPTKQEGRVNFLSPELVSPEVTRKIQEIVDTQQRPLGKSHYFKKETCRFAAKAIVSGVATYLAYTNMGKLIGPTSDDNILRALQNASITLFSSAIGYVAYQCSGIVGNCAAYFYTRKETQQQQLIAQKLSEITADQKTSYDKIERRLNSLFEKAKEHPQSFDNLKARCRNITKNLNDVKADLKTTGLNNEQVDSVLERLNRRLTEINNFNISCMTRIQKKLGW